MDNIEAVCKNFVFSDDFSECVRKGFGDCCWHVLCLGGSAHFELDNIIYNVVSGNVVIKSSGNPITKFRCSSDFKCRILLISWNYIRANTPKSEYNAIGALSTLQNPIMMLQPAQMERCMCNFDEIQRRLTTAFHNFFSEVLRRAVEIMILDFYDIHAMQQSLNDVGVSQSSRILQRFVALLEEGCSKKERKVDYYASRLCISPKYLSEVCVAKSGHNASFWIDRYTIDIIVRELDNHSKSFKEIADELNFSSASYFCRYVKRMLGVSPAEYRKLHR